MAERTVASRLAYEGRLLRLRLDDVVMDSGRRVTREIVEHPGAVAMVAWDGQRLALVRQWRQAVKRDTLEIPAGNREPGEEPRRTAERELAEEVGLAAATWEAGPTFWTAPGFCTEVLSIWLATDLSPRHLPAPEDEAIGVEWLTLDEARTAVADGRICDAKSLVGIDWLARWVAAREERA